MENTFDTRYKGPAMRNRAETGSSEPSENPMEKPAVEEAGPDTDESASVFAPAEAFGGQPPKEGMKGSYEVKAVDPETREAELVLTPAVAEEAAEPTETPATESPLEGMS